MVLLMLPLSFSHQDCSQSLFVLAQPSWLCYSHPDKSALKPQDEMITSQLYEWMYACPLQGYRTLSPRLSANIGRSDSYRLSGIILNCTTTAFSHFQFYTPTLSNIKRSDTDGLRTCHNICFLYCPICVYFLSFC